MAGNSTAGMKRMMDILASAFGLLVLLPLMLMIGVSIWLIDGRPILFRQMRVGWRGCEFILYKYRTMTVSAGSEKGFFEAGMRQRITSIGRFLRRYKIDELPQLWNVLRGDMSLVGPRPEVRKWVEAYPVQWAYIHRVRPGITDPASILFKNEEEILAASSKPEEEYKNNILPRKLELYSQYVHTQSLIGDLYIILETLLALSSIKAIHSAKNLFSFLEKHQKK